MAQSFITTKLAGHRTLVEGFDNMGTAHQTILNSEEFDEIEQHFELEQADDVFNQAVAAFFAPLTEAAEQHQDQVAQGIDPAFLLVVEEGQAGQAARDQVVIELGLDTVILRMLAVGDTSRLLWVGDVIEVLAYVQPTLEEADAPFDWHDQFTGATITPRSIVKTVKNTLKYVAREGDALFAKPAEIAPAPGSKEAS